MGGIGSGLQFGRPTVEASLIIDLAWMLRTGRAKAGCNISGHLNWTRRGQPIMQADYTAHMATAGAERLELSYGGDAVRQTIRLRHTVPNYGGERWWMVCPYRGALVNNLYLPPGGDRFASRKVYRLGYRSERSTAQARALDRLFTLQRKLGCQQGLGVPLRRPKGMWRRTFARQLERYTQLEADALAEFVGLTDETHELY